MTIPATIPAPFDRFQGEVLPEWIDHNEHMNLAYYTVLFDRATDLLFDMLGLGLDYRHATQMGTFVAETHNRYERELLVGARVRVATQIIAADDKRLYLAHEMFALDSGPNGGPDGGPDGGQRAATQELMFLHVDLALRRVSPFPEDLRRRVAAAAAVHAALPRPDWVGRRIAMPQRD